MNSGGPGSPLFMCMSCLNSVDIEARAGRILSSWRSKKGINAGGVRAAQESYCFFHHVFPVRDTRARPGAGSWDSVLADVKHSWRMPSADAFV